MKNIIKHSVILVTLLLASLAFNAQPPAGAGPPGGPSGGALPPCWPPPCVPIDGGISFLIAIGAAFGGKKAYDHFKVDEDNID